MNCPKCRKNLAKDWNYCPYCGLEIERTGGFLDSINRVFSQIFSGFSNGLSNSKPMKGKSFTIRIKTPQGERVIGSEPRTKQKLLKMPEELIEPKVTIKKIGEELDILIELPGVESLNNVNLMHLGESLEVRAVHGGKGYFKIISVPKDYKIINKRISDGVLEVRMA